MRHPLVWGTVFLLAGLLFLGLAHGSATDVDEPLASEAPDGEGTSEDVASRAHLGISLLSAITGVALLVLSVFCYGSRLLQDAEGSSES